VGKLLILSKQITPPNATVHFHPPIFTHSCSPTDFHPPFFTHQVSENSEGVLADVCQRLLFLNKNNLSCLRVVIHGRPIIVLHPLLWTRWAYYAKNTSWYTISKEASPSIIHPIFENFDSKMVVVLSQLWVLVFHP